MIWNHRISLNLLARHTSESPESYIYIHKSTSQTVNCDVTQFMGFLISACRCDLQVRCECEHLVDHTKVFLLYPAVLGIEHPSGLQSSARGNPGLWKGCVPESKHPLSRHRRQWSLTPHASSFGPLSCVNSITQVPTPCPAPLDCHAPTKCHPSWCHVLTIALSSLGHPLLPPTFVWKLWPGSQLLHCNTLTVLS